MADDVVNALNFIEWLRLVELPIIGAFALGSIYHLLSDGKADAAHRAAQAKLEGAVDLAKVEAARDLANYKLEAMDKFATVTNLGDVEKRLTTHLDRIETKLDKKT